VTLAADGAVGSAEYEERRRRLAGRLRLLNIDAVVVGDGRDLLYLTGFSGVTELGPNPLGGVLAAVAVVDQDAHATLLVPEPDHWYVSSKDAAVAVSAYPTFAEETTVRPRARAADAIARHLQSVRAGTTTKWGYSGSGLPASVLDRLRTLVDTGALIDVDYELSALRMRKSATEIAALRESITLCDAAQAAVHNAAAAGASHEALTQVVRHTVAQRAGRPLPVLLEVSWGAGYGTESRTRPLREGDLLLTDIAPRLGEYWGDSCDTRAVGVTTVPRRKLLAAVRDALLTGTEAVRAGIPAASVDSAMRERIARDYPVYTGHGGHGLGLDYHESPRLVPSEGAVLDEDMVIALEPGIYLEDACARLEHIVRVTADGCEVLSKHLDVSGHAQRP
jgi:Xaa-Pro aminopeptidase